MKEGIKRADFAGEFIVREEVVTRPVVTVIREENSLARNEKDLIVCGCCGSLNNYKKKYCGGCGAKFKKIKIEEARKLDQQIKEREENNIEKNQMNIEDFLQSK